MYEIAWNIGKGNIGYPEFIISAHEVGLFLETTNLDFQLYSQ